jgi:hypothetical protein
MVRAEREGGSGPKRVGPQAYQPPGYTIPGMAAPLETKPSPNAAKNK